uniref:Uncharacterized protein n=1 Tax=Ditylenchus dipsaci TaxID=166011 RepID=A0A915EWF2_9BILA
MRGWGIENETCAEKSAIILLSPVHQLPDPESDDLNCFYADKTNAFRQKRYFDGLLEMLEEQHLQIPSSTACIITYNRNYTSTSAFTTPKYTNHTTNKTDPSNLTPANPRVPTISNSNKNAGQEEQHFDKVNQLEVEQWQKQQMQIQKAQYLQCSSTHTTNTLLILLFLTITSQTLLLVAIIVLKMRGFFNKPAAAIMPTATTVTSPPPMYNMKPVMSPPSFFDHLEDKKNGILSGE